MRSLVVLTICSSMLFCCTNSVSKAKDGKMDKSQTDSLLHISEIWKADSLGKNSQRYKLIRYDSLNKAEIISVGGVSFINFTKKQITDLLGTPNNTIRSGDSTWFDYLLAPHCAFSEEGCYKWVLEISFHSDTVQKFYSSFIESRDR